MHIEDLKRGDWVAVISEIIERHSFSGEIDHYKTYTTVTGVPLNIIAIDPPFIAATPTPKNKRLRCVLDIRQCQVSKLSAAYVKAMRLQEHEAELYLQADGEPLVSSSRESTQAECPVCQGPLITRLINASAGVWMFCCDECGFQGGRGQS